ncbi:MAG: hypothetical protein LBR36_00835, partial [Bacteroidales bacterium]|nr:hypothetical protein [Bacteroidales bacterium]
AHKTMITLIRIYYFCRNLLLKIYNPKNICYCTGMDGRLKNRYSTKEYAEDIADEIMQDIDYELFVYHCPCSDCYHLTKCNNLFHCK